MSCKGMWVWLALSLAVSGCDDGEKRADVDGSADGSVDGSVDGDGGMDASPRDADVLEHDGGDGSVLGGDGGDADSPFAMNDAGQVLCGTSVCACSDGLDGDSDGLVDLADPECVSPWDNDEGSFATGIAGDNRREDCQDCFFDGNTGAGNDDCRVPTSCIETGEPTSGQGVCNSCVASDKCKSVCQAYTPNGCDCFGCCTVQLGSNITKNIVLGDGCDIDGTDTTGCTECVPSTTCVNTCGRCELCPGKTVADLPADCTTGGTSEPTPSCDDGATRCGEGLPECASGEVCTFGCCVLVPIIII